MVILFVLDDGVQRTGKTLRIEDLRVDRHSLDIEGMYRSFLEINVFLAERHGTFQAYPGRSVNVGGLFLATQDVNG